MAATKPGRKWLTAESTARIGSHSTIATKQAAKQQRAAAGSIGSMRRRQREYIFPGLMTKCRLYVRKRNPQVVFAARTCRRISLIKFLSFSSPHRQSLARACSDEATTDVHSSLAKKSSEWACSHREFVFSIASCEAPASATCGWQWPTWQTLLTQSRYSFPASSYRNWPLPRTM